MNSRVSELIESLKNYRELPHTHPAAQLMREASDTLRDCRNVLCLRCGKYHEAYLGACDGCRWKR